MTNQEILEKAIQKAIEGRCPIAPEHTLTYAGDGVMNIESKVGVLVLSIFNHDFAKALWGEKFINPEFRDDTGSKVVAFKQTSWKHHLRQMVIAPDPIKYLGENI